MLFSPICLIFFLRALRCYCCSRNAILCTLRETSVYPWWRPLLIPGWQPSGPGAVLMGPSHAELPAGLGSGQSRFLWQPRAGGDRGSAPCPMGLARGERRAPACAEGWLVLTPGPVLWSSTWRPRPLELHLPGLRPACAPSGRGSSHCSLGELIAVWGFWLYLLSGTICGNLISFFSTVRLLDNAVH